MFVWSSGQGGVTQVTRVSVCRELPAHGTLCADLCAHFKLTPQGGGVGGRDNQGRCFKCFANEAFLCAFPLQSAPITYLLKFCLCSFLFILHLKKKKKALVPKFLLRKESRAVHQGTEFTWSQRGRAHKVLRTKVQNNLYKKCGHVHDVILLKSNYCSPCAFIVKS